MAGDLAVAAGVVLARDVVRATGPDAPSFLQGQLSQDVEGLAVGGSAPSLLLSPQGKVDAFLRVTRTAPDELLLDTDAGWGPAVVRRLERFKLRVRCDLAVLEGWGVVALRGREAVGLPAPGGVCRVDPETPGVPGADWLGPGVTVPGPVPVVDPQAYEVLRIRCGVPRMGAELDESTIPAAAGVVERSVSFTKGCYTGQELVARIDSRGGNTPVRLRGVVVAGAVPPAGAAVEVDGAGVGSLTSVAATGDGGAVALAYVRRAVEPPAPAALRWDGGTGAAEVRPLPMG
jgi:tRNA-modifying protein YgfZ